MEGDIEAKNHNDLYGDAAETQRVGDHRDTELKLIAAAAIIGLKSSPKNGYSTPAAIGTPSAL